MSGEFLRSKPQGREARWIEQVYAGTKVPAYQSWLTARMSFSTAFHAAQPFNVIRWMASVSLTLPHGGPLFEECSCALGFVRGATELTEPDRFAQEGKVKGQFQTFVDGAEGFCDSQGSVGGNLLRQGFGARHQFGSWNYFIDKPDAKGLVSVDDRPAE